MFPLLCNKTVFISHTSRKMEQQIVCHVDPTVTLLKRIAQSVSVMPGTRAKSHS